MNIKNAFTQAEVLITLMILGVTAAVTMPILIDVMPNKDQSMYQKTFHTIETISADIVQDYTKYDNDFDATNNKDLSQAPLPTAHTTYSGVTLTASNAYCYFLAERINIQEAAPSCSGSGVNFTTFNGMKVSGLAGNSYPKTIILQPTGSKHKYSMTIDKYGKASVSTSASGIDSKDQAKAYAWIESQTKIKK